MTAENTDSSDNQCGNILSYDPSSGSYVICEQNLSEVLGNPGEQVKCPGCGNDVSIPYVSQIATPAKREFAPIESPDSIPVENSDSPLELQSDDIPLSDVLDAPSQSNRPKEGVLQYDDFSRNKSCAHCGTLVEKSMTHCPACKVRLRFDDSTPLEELKYHPTGFQLWLSRLGNAESKTRFDVIIHLVVFSIFISTCGLTVALLGLWSILALPFPIAFITVYFLACKQWYTFQRRPWDPITGWELQIWMGTLTFIRKLNWRTLNNPAGDGLLDLRQKSISDSTLMSVEGLENCQILDLEGASITDQGLRQLRGKQNIRFLVLKDTNVTHDGVVRLQQNLSRAWIWH